MDWDQARRDWQRFGWSGAELGRQVGVSRAMASRKIRQWKEEQQSKQREGLRVLPPPTEEKKEPPVDILLLEPLELVELQIRQAWEDLQEFRDNPSASQATVSSRRQVGQLLDQRDALIKQGQTGFDPTSPEDVADRIVQLMEVPTIAEAVLRRWAATEDSR